MDKYRLWTFGLFFLYLVGMTALMIWQGIGMAPDRYALVLLLGSLLIKRTRTFLLDWIPFLFILISYDFLRGFADNVTARVHVTELINVEHALFGFIPTVELQKALFNPHSLQWYDYLATILYFPHFALPLGFGFLIWLANRSFFRQFVTGILLMSYGAFATYLIYPAAPPWYAQEHGFLDGVTKVMFYTSRAFSANVDFPTIYHRFNPNEVAALPSLHAAYPLFVFFFLFQLFRWKSLPFLLYVVGVWWSIVYLGEHYVVDVIAGIIFAITFYFLSVVIHHKRHWVTQHFGKQIKV